MPITGLIFIITQRDTVDPLIVIGIFGAVMWSLLFIGFRLDRGKWEYPEKEPPDYYP